MMNDDFETLNIEIFAENKTLRQIEFPLYKEIGKGGFGKVYLSNKNEKLIALKLVEGISGEKEFESLNNLLGKIKLNKNSSLIEISELYKVDNGLVYTMPLADNINKDTEDYLPATLANYVEHFKSKENFVWFTVDLIKEFSDRIFEAVLELNSYGILHRDIKPTNIVFLENEPYLADFGIVQCDTQFPKEMGTSSYLPPYSYIESGGNPDMWGLASTLFFMLTGYEIEFFDRKFAQYPKGYEDYYDEAEIAQYTHWRRCIFRAISEDKSRRFTSIQSFKNAFSSPEQAQMNDENFNCIDNDKALIDLDNLTVNTALNSLKKAMENEKIELSKKEEIKIKGLKNLEADTNKLISEDPENGDNYFFKSLSLWQLKREQEALECAKKAIELNTVFLWRAYRIKAYTLANLGQIDLAKIAMAKSEELKNLEQQ